LITDDGGTPRKGKLNASKAKALCEKIDCARGNDELHITDND